MKRNLKQIVQIIQILAAATWAATSTSIASDLQGLKNFAYELSLGVFALDGSNYITASFLESDDNSTFTAAPASAYYSGDILVYNLAASHQSKTHLIQYRGGKRYVKLVLTKTGVVSMPLAINSVSISPEFQPIQ